MSNTVLAVTLNVHEATAIGIIGHLSPDPVVVTPEFRSFATKAVAAIDRREPDADTITVEGVTSREALAVALSLLPYMDAPITEAVVDRLTEAADAAGIPA